MATKKTITAGDKRAAHQFCAVMRDIEQSRELLKAGCTLGDDDSTDYNYPKAILLVERLLEDVPTANMARVLTTWLMFTAKAGVPPVGDTAFVLGELERADELARIGAEEVPAGAHL